MGRRENKVETYLGEQVEKIFNGITRKWVSPGHNGVMDQICFIDPEWFVEVKTVDGKHESQQQREALRLIAHGARVAVVYGHDGVDNFIEWLKTHRDTKPKVQVVFK